jgi:hypothetical protein
MLENDDDIVEEGLREFKKNPSIWKAGVAADF